MSFDLVLCATDLSVEEGTAWRSAARFVQALDARVRILHVIEPVTFPYPAEGPGREEFLGKLRADLLSEAGARLQDADPSVVIQAMLSLKHAGVSGAKELAKTATEKSSSAGVYAINEQIWKEETPEDPFLLPLLGPAGLKSYRAGRVFYESLCFACHGKDGLGTPSVPGRTIAPPLRHSPRLLGPADSAITILLQGLDGPLDLRATQPLDRGGDKRVDPGALGLVAGDELDRAALARLRSAHDAGAVLGSRSEGTPPSGPGARRCER